MHFPRHVYIVFSILLCNVYQTVGYQQCEANPLVVNPTAEARFALVLSIRQNSGTEECAVVSQSALQTIATVEWAVKKVNEAGILTGMTMGFDIYDDCGMDRYAVYSALNAVSKSYSHKIRSCNTNRTVYHLGIVGASRSQTTASILEMLKGKGIPVLSPFASLPELRKYSNFLRTTPADSEQVQAMVQTLRRFGWTYVAVIHTKDNYGTGGIQDLKKVAKEHGICVNILASLETTENFDDRAFRDDIFKRIRTMQAAAADDKIVIIYFGIKNVIASFFNPIYIIGHSELNRVQWIMSDFVGTSTEVFKDASINTVKGYTKDILTFSTSSIYIEEVEQFFNTKWTAANLPDPSDALKKLINEVPPRSGKEPWRNDYVMPLVDGVYVLAETLRYTFKEICSEYKTVCDNFENYLKSNFLEHMKGISVSYASLNESTGPRELIVADHKINFTSSGDLHPDQTTPLYDLNMYTNHSFIKVGRFIDGQLQINKSLLSRQDSFTSSCSQVCSECLDLPEIPYKYKHGGNTGNDDSLILGIFTLHDKSDKNNFDCGDFRTHSQGLEAIGVESFFHAVEQAKLMTGVNFSALAFDDCYSLNRASYIISQFLSGRLKIPNGVGGFVNPIRTAVVIGPYSSGVTVPLTFNFMRLRTPVISYASTSPDLDDRIDFPYFYRTVPSDVVQTRAMMHIVREMGWEYIGLLYVENNYGSKGQQLLMKYATENGICVGNPIVVSDSDHTNDYFFTIISRMKQTGAEVFIYFGTDSIIGKLLQAMTTWNENFIFLASEDNYDILERYGRVSKGSLVFKFEIVTYDKGFRQYLEKRKPSIERENSWFRDFWSYFFQCSPEGGFDKLFTKECSTSTKFSDSNITQFLNDQTVNHIMNAVYAAGVALKEVQTEICVLGPPPCNNSINTLPDKVANIFQKVTLDLKAQGKSRVFDDDRNGNIGFKILNVQQLGSLYSNEQVGEYINNRLSLSKNKVQFYGQSGSKRFIKAECSKETCGHCFLYNASITTSLPVGSTPIYIHPEEFRTADIVLIVMLSTLSIFLCISIVVITCYFRKKIKELRLRMLNHQPKIVYSNTIGSTNHINHMRTENQSNGSIVFQNGESSSNIQAPAGVDNEAILPEDYLQLVTNDNSVTVRDSPAGYSPLTPNSPPIGLEMVKIKTRQDVPNQKKKQVLHRPDLPPRDHPQSKNNHSNSSHDSGNLTPNGYPKMGTGPTVSNQASPRPQSVGGSDMSPAHAQGHPRMGTSVQNSPTSALGFSPQEYSIKERRDSPLTPNFTPPDQSPIRTPNFTPPKLSPVSLETFSPMLLNDQRRRRVGSDGISSESSEKISQV